jgi:hypothetical protein
MATPGKDLISRKSKFKVVYKKKRRRTILSPHSAASCVRRCWWPQRRAPQRCWQWRAGLFCWVELRAAVLTLWFARPLPALPPLLRPPRTAPPHGQLQRVACDGVSASREAITRSESREASLSPIRLPIDDRGQFIDSHTVPGIDFDFDSQACSLVSPYHSLSVAVFQL